MPKVSVIIPVYNVEKYLRKCLDSVVNQTLSDIEIICVDDGSPDNSLSILKEYANNDNRFIIIKQKNMGVATARNNAIDKATGEFVCFMDSDDYYPDNSVLEILYTKAKENDVYISGGEMSSFVDGTTKIKHHYEGTTLSGYMFAKDGIIKYTDYQFDYGYHRFIYNREFLKRNNIYFPNYLRFQDPPFFVQAMYQAQKFYAVHKIVYRYRKRIKPLQWTTKKSNDFLDAICSNFFFAKEHNLAKLMDYCIDRFEVHYPQIEKYLNRNSKKTIQKIIKIEPSIKPYIVTRQKIMHNKKIKHFIAAIFSIKNASDKKHKVITILGIKIKIKKYNQKGEKTSGLQ